MDAESREEDTIIKSLRCFKLTPKLCAQDVPKEFPISGFIDLKQKNNPINNNPDKTQI